MIKDQGGTRSKLAIEIYLDNSEDEEKQKWKL